MGCYVLAIVIKYKNRREENFIDLTRFHRLGCTE